MIILALETSSPVASIALLNDHKLIMEYTTNYKKNHSERLMPMIDEALRVSEMKPEDIDVVAVSIGPGSFTGLRIGVATAKAIAHALNKKIIGVSTLEATAYNLPYCNGYIASIVNALRGDVFGGLYKWEGTKLKEVLSPELFSIEEYIKRVEEINAGKENIFIVNEGVDIMTPKITDREGWIIPNEAISIPKAVSIGACAYQRIICSPEEEKFDDCYTISPIYMRKSAAEEKQKE